MQLINSNDYKSFILDTFDQVSIFSTYLEIPENDINYCLENKSFKISNPLRVDVNPSLSFIPVMDKQTSMFKLRFHDWADPSYRGDCFDLVGKVRGLNANNSIDFIAICNDIIYSMKHKTLQRDVRKLTNDAKYEAFTSIHIEPRLWNEKDINFWKNNGLPFNEIRHLIFPLKHAFISNYCEYTEDKNDPCYAWISGYYENKTLYTLYYPTRDRSNKFKSRFKKNNKYYPLENIHELKPADILVITKAYKEKLLIQRLIHRLETKYIIQVTNFTSESVILSDNFALKLFDIYQIIVINTDFDYIGLYTSRKHKQKFGMLRLIPTTGKYGTFDFGGKDLCEIYNNRGEQYCIDLLQESYNYVQKQLELEI